jgi:hypothetical protein
MHYQPKAKLLNIKPSSMEVTKDFKGLMKCRRIDTSVQ